MMPEYFFTGQTERALIDMLEEKGNLRYEFIYSCYSSTTMARNFIKKVVGFGIATISAPNTLQWIPPIERNKNEN